MGIPSSLCLLQHKYELDSESPDSAQTICFIKQDSFKPNPTNPICELVPQEKGLKTEGSASHSAFK